MTWRWTRLILRLRANQEAIKLPLSGPGTTLCKTVPRAFALPSGESVRKQLLACKSRVRSLVTWRPLPPNLHATSQSTIVTTRSKSRWAKSASPTRPPTSSRRLFHLVSSLRSRLELRQVLQSLDWFHPLSSVLRLYSLWAVSEKWKIIAFKKDPPVGGMMIGWTEYGSHVAVAARKL